MVRASEPSPPGPFPQAPSQAEWDALSPEARARVVDALPNEVTDAELSPPEGDLHFQAKVGVLDALRGYFERQRRRVYFAAELPVYYPARPRFAPDVLAVPDVPTHPRGKWVVSAEGKGLDFALEVHVGGDRKKDAERNVTLYASLGIPEYFMVDLARQQLFGYRLPGPDARAYVPILPQGGRFSSDVLGLEVQLEEGRLRFYAANALLLESPDLIRRLQHLVDEEVHLRQEEARLRQEAEARVAALEAELAALKKQR